MPWTKHTCAILPTSMQKNHLCTSHAFLPQVFEEVLNLKITRAVSYTSTQKYHLCLRQAYQSIFKISFASSKLQMQEHHPCLVQAQEYLHAMPPSFSALCPYRTLAHTRILHVPGKIQLTRHANIDETLCARPHLKTPKNALFVWETNAKVIASYASIMQRVCIFLSVRHSHFLPFSPYPFIPRRPLLSLCNV